MTVHLTISPSWAQNNSWDRRVREWQSHCFSNFICQWFT